MEELNLLLKEAETVYFKNFSNKVYYGRCVFLSWYCDNASCKFCYRSTQKDRIKFAKHARRSPWSIITELLFCKAFGWKVEFLTGGYKILPFEEIIENAKLVSKIYGKKIWVNLGALEKEELRKLLPYIEGVTASIETINQDLHDKVCPKKPLGPCEALLEYADEFGLKKSITVIIGLGETKDDFELLRQFIEKHKLDRITFYPLKPVKGTPYTKGPSSEYYAWWIAKTRIAFPKLEIVAGTTLKRINNDAINVAAPVREINFPDCFSLPQTNVRGRENQPKLCELGQGFSNEIAMLMRAGANAITKFPATKAFGSKEAYVVEEEIKRAGREFEGTLTEMKDEIDWNKMIEGLDVKEGWKTKVKDKLKEYLQRAGKS